MNNIRKISAKRKNCFPAILISIALSFPTICGCASKENQILPEMPLPPAILLEDARLPGRDGAKTAGDLVRLILADEAAIRAKNADLRALREWRQNIINTRRKEQSAGE